MSEVINNAPQEFWRPPIVQTETAVPSMVDVCNRCQSEFMVGAKFCHGCGAARQRSVDSYSGNIWTRSLVLLQVLDDGRLTDGQGRTVDFRNSVVIMTSNLGSQVIQELSGEANYAKMKAAVMQVVTQHFRPEFINRVDEIVVFHSLGREQIRAIVDIQLGRLRQRLAERDITLRLDDDARDKIGEAGFDTVYGARPLKRAIQAQIENPLAQKILSGDFVAGDRVVAKLKRDALVFEKERVH